MQNKMLFYTKMPEALTWVILAFTDDLNDKMLISEDGQSHYTLTG